MPPSAALSRDIRRADVRGAHGLGVGLEADAAGVASTAEPVVPAPPLASGQESDAVLVGRCLRGDERAWEQIIERYKRLIYSIPLKYNATVDDAGEIFQAVCVDLVTELPRLRKPEALKGWLVSVTKHKALKWKVQSRRQSSWEPAEDDTHAIVDGTPSAADVLEEVEREQAVRAAVAELPDRCRQLVEQLFFTSPPHPYAEVAARLGLATGSIGFIRGRCLKKLEVALKRAGL